VTANLGGGPGSGPGRGPDGGHGDEGADRERPGSASEVPDPDPATTPGLEPGGGVMPGDTPPSEAGTSGLSAPEPKLPSRRTNLVVPIVIAVLVAAAALAFFAARL
jgi:hypothetical protein